MAEIREVILLMTHFLDDRIVGMYRRLVFESGGRDVFVLFNRTDDANPGYQAPADVRVFAFDENDLKALNYPCKGRGLRDTDIELFSFPFRRVHPYYRRTWVVEYDVDFTGVWRDLFDAFVDDDAALLATNVHRWADNPGWDNWPSVKGPAGRPDPVQLVRAFLPFYRLSDVAYASLDNAYRRGWRGHYESVIPTILEQAGLKIEDLGGDGEFVAPGNRNRFYTSTPASNDLSPGTFVFRPVMTAVGERPNTLWHPVKPPTHTRGWNTGRKGLITRRMRILARSGINRLSRLIDR